MKDEFGHDVFEGAPIHNADRNYGSPYQVGQFWYRNCHCTLCGCVMSKPVTQSEIEKKLVVLP